MRKKQYIMPVVEIVSAEEVSFICGSGENNGQIHSGTGSLEKGSDGNFHGDSKQSDSVIDWDNEDF